MDVLTLFNRDKLRGMKTEPIGSIPRPLFLIQTIAAFQTGEIGCEILNNAYANALRDTIDRFEQTGSPVITDGEQTKPSFATYPLSGLDSLAPDGVTIPSPMATCANCPASLLAPSAMAYTPPVFLPPLAATPKLR